MIVDASAILAIVLGEEDADRFARALVRVKRPRMSAVNFLEAAIRIDQLGDPSLTGALGDTMKSTAVLVVAATPEHAMLAREAYRRFGKGNHKARLNLADCFAYALAKKAGMPLLFKGDDFTRTDIVSALP